MRFGVGLWEVGAEAGGVPGGMSVEVVPMPSMRILTEALLEVLLIVMLIVVELKNVEYIDLEAEYIPVEERHSVPKGCNYCYYSLLDLVKTL